MERSDESDDDSIMPPLITKEEMDVMDSSGQYDDELMTTEMLEDICEGSKPRPSINRIETCYKIRDCIE